MIELGLFAQKPMPSVGKSLGEQALPYTGGKLNGITIVECNLAMSFAFAVYHWMTQLFKHIIPCEISMNKDSSTEMFKDHYLLF